MCMCLCVVCGFVHMSVGVHGGQQRAFELLELEVQVGVSCPVWILGSNQTWECWESSTCS